MEGNNIIMLPVGQMPTDYWIFEAPLEANFQDFFTFFLSPKSVKFSRKSSAAKKHFKFRHLHLGFLCERVNFQSWKTFGSSNFLQNWILFIRLIFIHCKPKSTKLAQKFLGEIESPKTFELNWVKELWAKFC